MQGIPGSGKSTLARLLQAGFHNLNPTSVGCQICSTDDYHYVDGVYKFQPEKLGYFHKLNQEAAIAALSEGKSVIVDNTNIKVKDVKPYVKAAVALNVPVVFIRVTSNFENVHGVPADVVARMRAQMQDLSLERCLGNEKEKEDEQK